MANINKTAFSKNSSVLFATFSPWVKGKRLPTNGNVEPMRDFLITRVKKFVLLDQPLQRSDFLLPRYEINERGKKPVIEQSSWWMKLFLPLLKLTNNPQTQITFKIRDFFSVMALCLKPNNHFDIFIGLESINALAGIILRKIGLVKIVVYYVSDYSPNRYSQKWFNNLYLWLDRFCAMHADYIWDVSRAMQPARIEAGLDPKKSAPVIHVSNGLYPSQIKFNPLNKIKPYALVYMGTLGEENGPDLIIEALPQILKKFPKTIFYVIGGGEKNLERLKHQAEKLKVADKIKFYGFVTKGLDMSKILRSCYLALAPYRAIPGSPRYYADAGKIRAYCAAGVPVISSQVPPLGIEVAQYGAAMVVNDNISEFVGAITKIFSDHNLYLQMRRRAISFAKYCTWDNVFNSAFSRLEYYDK